MNEVLTPTRLRQLQAVQGTRGVVGALVSKACLLNNGVYYVDVLAEHPELTEAVKRDGELKYGDDDGNFSLAKLAQDVKTNIDNKRKNALAAAAEAGTPATFPNIEHVQDDEKNTVYVVNWDLAPDEQDDDDDDA